jgi:enoyl-CoA hydratase/carnithine racemase
MVAAVNGPAMGLGCSLALSCDVVLLSDQAVMADPHVNVGLVAGDGGAALWPLYTSLLKAKEYLFTGETISADEAVRLGLANRVVEHAVLMDEAMKLADMLASRPQQALRDTKRALNMHIEQAAFGPFEMAIQAEIKSMASAEHAAFVAGAARRAKRQS